MTDGKSSGVQLTCSDPYRQDLYNVDKTQTSIVLSPGRYSDRERGPDISLSYPVEESSLLPYVTHLEAQLAAASDVALYNDLCASSEAGSASRQDVFDIALLRVLDRAFCAEGRPIGDCSTGNKKIAALSLHEAYSMESYPMLETHLEDSEKVAGNIGFTSVPDQSTFNRAEAACEYSPNIFENATRRAVHAVYRNGVPIPDDVIDNYCLESRAKITPSHISADIKSKALFTAVDRIWHKLVEGVSFGRADNKQFSVKQLLAACAIAARRDGFNGVHEASLFRYNSDEIIKPPTIREFVRNLELSEIPHIFENIYNNFVILANEWGFFSQPYTYAIDTTWIDSGGNKQGAINNPEKCASDWGWCFVILHIVNHDARFTVNVNAVQNKSNISERARALLQRFVKQSEININIKRILADRGFYDQDAVTCARDTCGENFLIRAKYQKEGSKKGEVSKIFDRTSEGDSVFELDVDFSKLDLNPNLIIHYVPQDAEKWDSGSHVGFLTDLTRDQISEEEAFQIYRRRWSIESYLGETKGNFNIPTQSPLLRVQLFVFRFQTLLYNIHTLINRSLSPELGVPLDVSHRQIPEAIAEVTFSRKQPVKPAILG